MEIQADEHIKKHLRRSLEKQGISVYGVEGSSMRGADDPKLLEYAVENGRILLTNDDDFEQLVAEIDHPGIIFLTTQYARVQEASREIVRLMDQLSPEEFLNGKFYVP